MPNSTKIVLITLSMLCGIIMIFVTGMTLLVGQPAANTTVAPLIAKDRVNPYSTRFILRDDDNIISLYSTEPIEYSVVFLIDGKRVSYRCSRDFYKYSKKGTWFDLEVTNKFWGAAKVLSINEQVM